MDDVTLADSYVLSSDGSGNPLLSGAASCIFESSSYSLKGKFVAYLGPSTGNEAEIMGGLLGFSVIKLHQQLGNSSSLQDTHIRWQTDSQYLIRSIEQLRAQKKISEKMPNFGLWEALWENAQHFRIEAKHVKARSGNRRNEACDHASRWIQRKGKRLLLEFPEGRIGRLKETVPEESWFLLDLSRLLLALRDEDKIERELQLKSLETRLQTFLGQIS